MLPSLQPPTKEIDVDFLVFVERHASDLLRWDLLTFFGRNPEFCGTISQIAEQLGRTSQTIWAELGDLALAGVLQQTRSEQGDILYSLTPELHLRRLALKLAGVQLSG